METYINYDIHISQQGGNYHLRVDCSLAGTAIAQCIPPFSDEELSMICWRYSASQSDPKEIGQRLYDAIFQDAIRVHLRECLATARSRNNGLRIRIRLKSPQLTCLPWEYLYDMDRDIFFALSIRTPMVRYLELPVAEPSISVDGAIHILIMIADPVDLAPRLDVDREWTQLRAAFQDLEDGQKVVLHRLMKATRQDLQRYLRQNKVDIFHFIGHGHFDSQDEEGALVFEDAHGQAELISSDTLARLLKDRMPRLIYLNSCDTAQTGLLDPMTGTAQELVQQGIPAVVAMRTAIQDDKAIQIAHEFYLSLTDGFPVDAALVEGRKAIFNTHEPAEWGTPVLFMRSPDGILWKPKTLKENFSNRSINISLALAKSYYNKALLEKRAVGIGVSLTVFLMLALVFGSIGGKPEPSISSNTLIVTDTSMPTRTPTSLLFMATDAYIPMGNTDEATPTSIHTITPTPLNPSTITPISTATLIPSTPTLQAGATRLSPTDGATYVYVPNGEFLLGSTDRQVDIALEICDTLICSRSSFTKEQPQREIYLDSFWIMQTEVTVELYGKFIEAGGYANQAYWSEEGWSWKSGFLGLTSKTQPGYWNDSNWNGPQQPVISVSWFEAEAYANWLSAESGLVYKLPTEAQWEKAARGTEALVFPWGDLWDTEKVNSESQIDSYTQTAPVGSFPAGASLYGALDMAGNVLEWTQDGYDEKYYARIDDRNPVNTQDNTLRTVRGGAWDGDPSSMRTTYRYGFARYNRFINVGFRLVILSSDFGE